MRTLSFRIVLCAAVVALLGVAAAANTYDTHTLVAITTSGPEDVQLLYSCRIDIVGRQGDVYKALLTPEQFGDLTSKGLKIEILYDEMEQNRAVLAVPGWCTNTAAPCYWYPSKFNTTNPASGTLMKHLLDLYNAHPTITRLYNLGATQDGAYDIIAMKVTKNPDALEAEPKIRIYGNIHGDEVCGLMVACDTLDWILANYASSTTAQKLVDESEMWFIPMGNPYGNANQTRYNINNVDLNRNFWGPGGSDEPPAWSEKETQIIRDLTETATADHPKKRFATSLSFHGGETCFNAVYNYTSTATTDEPVFFSARTGGPTGGGRCSSLCASPVANGLAKAYQDGCTQSTFWYTNGADWYITKGDTNDWSYNVWSDLDTTVEVNVSKWPDSSTIPTYVAQHRQGVLNYMMKTFQGIHGLMTDQDTGTPLDGTVAVTCTASSSIPVPHPYQAVFTDPVAGDFHRVLQPGTYTVTCSAPGYTDRVVTGVVVTADTKSTCNCPMVGTTTLHAATYAFADLCSGTGSGGDGVLDPGEDATVSVTLANSGSRKATNVIGTLSTAVSGITILDGTASFADVPGSGTGASVAPHFTIRVAPSVACGTVVSFALHVVSDQGSWDDTLTRTVGNSVPGGTITDFSQNFGTISPPTLPTGWTTSSTGGNNWQSTNSYYCGAAGGMYYPYNASTAANSWAYTPGIPLTAGVTYTLSFSQKVQSATYPEIFEVKAGTAATPAGQTITVLASASYTNTTCATRTPTFTVPTTGTYYLGFHCTSAKDMYYLIVDDISLTHSGVASCTVHACTPSAGPKPVPDGRLSGTAMKGTRTTANGSTISVTYDTSTCSMADHSLLYGNLANVSTLTLSGSVCSIGNTSPYSWTTVPTGNNVFWVIVGDGGTTESSWGEKYTGGAYSPRSTTASNQCGNTAIDTSGTCP